MSPRYLGDTSVTARLNDPAVRARYMPLVQAGLVATCRVLDIEVGRTATSDADFQSLMRSRSALYPVVWEPDSALEVAEDTHIALAWKGQQRGVGVPDLIIAATAAFHRLTVLHYDHDFDLIAGITGQPTEWIVPRGSVD